MPHVLVGSLPYTIFLKDLGVRPIIYLYTELPLFPQTYGVVSEKEGRDEMTERPMAYKGPLSFS